MADNPQAAQSQAQPTNAVQTAQPKIKRFGWNLGDLTKCLEDNRDSIARVLPKHLTGERLIRIAVTAVGRSPRLLECDLLTVGASVIQAAQLGLEPDPTLGECYFVPYRNTDREDRERRNMTVAERKAAGPIYECQMQPGYKGLAKLCWNSGFVTDLDGDVVREKDRFDYQEGPDAFIDHKKAPGSREQRGKPTHAYAWVKLKTGALKICVLTASDVEEIRKNLSKSSDSPAWKKFWDDMAIKSALRRVFKMTPKSVQQSRAVALDEASEAGIPQRSADLPEIFALPEPEPDPEPDEPGGIAMPKRESELKSAAQVMTESGATVRKEEPEIILPWTDPRIPDDNRDDVKQESFWKFRAILKGAGMAGEYTKVMKNNGAGDDGDILAMSEDQAAHAFRLLYKVSAMAEQMAALTAQPVG